MSNYTKSPVLERRTSFYRLSVFSVGNRLVMGDVDEADIEPEVREGLDYAETLGSVGCCIRYDDFGGVTAAHLRKGYAPAENHLVETCTEDAGSTVVGHVGRRIGGSAVVEMEHIAHVDGACVERRKLALSLRAVVEIMDQHGSIGAPRRRDALIIERSVGISLCLQTLEPRVVLVAPDRKSVV